MSVYEASIITKGIRTRPMTSQNYLLLGEGEVLQKVRRFSKADQNII